MGAKVIAIGHLGPLRHPGPVSPLQLRLSGAACSRRLHFDPRFHDSHFEWKVPVTIQLAWFDIRMGHTPSNLPIFCHHDLSSRVTLHATCVEGRIASGAYHDPYTRMPALTRDPLYSRTTSMTINPHIVRLAQIPKFRSVKCEGFLGKYNLNEQHLRP